MKPANEKCRSSLCVSYELIGAITGEREFYNANHLLDIREDRRYDQKIRDYTNEAKLKGIVREPEALDLRLIVRAKTTGSWMTVRGTTVTGTVLAATYFCDFCARVMVLPPLTSKINATDALFTYPYVTDLSAATEALS